jgi:3-methylcrotonyl-CoA carboxylase alpha subunit
MFKRILIANRGEIACRIIHSAKKLGCTTVAIYSHADTDSLHTQLADEAYCIGADANSYLAITDILALAQQKNIDAIHPGYGFLAENADFARACTAHQINFIGPHADTIALMASKAQAKQQLEPTQVPLLPGYHGDAQDISSLRTAADKIGYPVLIKAAFGGGGKGMRRVDNAKDFTAALASAQHEALLNCKDARVIIEKYLDQPRHIECQLFADHHGNIVHVFTRDCSLQRRHQKIIEEAPAIDLPESLINTLTRAAITIAKAINYVNAGTVEFLVTGDQFYFLEMNTRLQVEHPVTEMISSIDCVAWQLIIASGAPLPLRQDQLHCKGHALEARLYAEDPAQDFQPSSGQINYLRFPPQTELRIDTGIREGDVISPHYDPLLAKIIAYGDDREQCCQRLRQALAQCQIAGIYTNLDFLKNTLDHASFQRPISTQFLQPETIADLTALPQLNLAVALATLYQYLRLTEHTNNPTTDRNSPWGAHDAWQAYTEAHLTFYYRHRQHQLCAELQLKPLTVTVGTETFELSGTLRDQQLQAQVNATSYHITLIPTATKLTLLGLDACYVLDTAPDTKAAQCSQPELLAPLPSTVVAIEVSVGDVVDIGATLIRLEAMKMEHIIQAPMAGRISEIFVNLGAQVDEGTELLTLSQT